MVELSEDGTEFFVHVPSLQASSYAVGYTFKAPFPTPSGIFGEVVGENDGDEGEGKNNYDEAFETELAINASISGSVEHLVQEATLKYHDSTEGTAEVGCLHAYGFPAADML